MIVITDNIEYAGNILPCKPEWGPALSSCSDTNVRTLASNLFESPTILQCAIETTSIWKYLFISEYATESQYDVLVRLSQGSVQLPHGVLCLAGSGDKFHGFRNRSWVSLPGNIHLSVFLAPMQQIDHFDIGFTLLSAVSVLDTIDSLEGLKCRARTKWVNDILIDNAKVSGVLTHTQVQGDVVTGAVLGIGLNVEITPAVGANSFVSRTASLHDFVSDSQACNQKNVFNMLVKHLSENYERFLLNGYMDLLNIYRERSVVIGEEVSIREDSVDPDPPEIARGKVTGIGDNLELYLEGIAEPITKGRLRMIPEC